MKFGWFKSVIFFSVYMRFDKMFAFQNGSKIGLNFSIKFNVKNLLNYATLEKTRSFYTPSIKSYL